MKIIFTFLVLFSLFSFDGNAQKCQVKEDPFTNEKVVSFNWKHGIVFYEYKGDEIKFGIRCNYNGEKNVVMEKGQKAFFKLDNNETMELLTCVDANPETQIRASQYAASVFTAYTFIFCLTKDELSKLAKYKMLAFRYPDTNGEYLDIILKGKKNKYAKAVLEGGQCILSNVQD
ncbi:hypothetical protein L3049_18425 [Labilibaculum sp. DW002]|uniref:Uncharacterized protein n=1 Tax=Paralabilibaculum antarcticum TaxID=2912572 RepID=A0ABT5W061_9BACT|nr:hypothetical protein [Labilibaculum sp. DW002]MDE5419969.1 hypothetical protein [Labilibaculum sp. DW002]